MPLTRKPKVGILIAGHKEYWTQFEGTRAAVLAGGRRFEAMVRQSDVDVVATDLVDTVELAFAAGRRFEAEQIDLLFVYLHCYVAAGRWVPGVVRLDVPIVLVNLPQSFDFEQEFRTGTGLFIGSPCHMPESYSALVRCGRTPVDVILGDPARDPRPARQTEEWCRVAAVLAAFKDCVVGYLGHSYEGMLDMNFDATAITETFGVYVKMLEMCELAEYVQSASQAEIDAKLEQMRTVFDFAGQSGDPLTRSGSNEDIEWAARCAVGLDQLIHHNGLSGLAYYYAGLNNLYERIGSNLIVGSTLLTIDGINLAGEGDMKTLLAMRATSALGAGGSFAEMAIVDLERDQVYVGHDGPHDLRVTDARPVIRGLSLYHGKRGHGVSVEFSLRRGPMSMLSVGSDARTRFKLVAAEGESMPGRLPQIANTFSRGHFGPDVAGFVRRWTMSGVPHHMSLCTGRIASMVEKLGAAWKLPAEIIR